MFFDKEPASEVITTCIAPHIISSSLLHGNTYNICPGNTFFLFYGFFYKIHPHLFFKEIHKTFVHKYVHNVLCLHNQSCDSLPVRPTNRLTGVGHIRLPIQGFGLDLLSGTHVATTLVSMLIWWFVPISAGCLIAKLRYHVLLSTELRLGLPSFTATPLYD